MSKFSKGRIQELLELFMLSNNKEFTLAASENKSLQKRDMIEAKVQIDRWGAVTTDWIFHPSQKEMVEALFPQDNNDLIKLDEALTVVIKNIYARSLDKSVDELTEEDLAGFSSLMKNEIPFRIWGADVHYSEHIKPNEVIGLALVKDGALMVNDSDNITNSIVFFELR